MATSIDDSEIDYESYEVVEADEKFEVIENLDDKISENFQLISISGETEREVHVDEDSIPILESIIGNWKPISSTNLQNFVNGIKLSEKNKLIWRDGIMVYEMKDGVLKTHFKLQSKKVGSYSFKPSVFMKDKYTSASHIVAHQIENNILKTKSTSLLDGRELWRIERFMKNGVLTIVNDNGNFKCERHYQRVAPKTKKSSIK